MTPRILLSPEVIKILVELHRVVPELKRKPLAVANGRPSISKLCGMGEHALCSGWTPKDGRGRLVRCECACAHKAKAKSQ